eukprot:CAMPEP_0174270690 /NCGR_PEP_ID=MMETSP0439-20130205/45391_1 /TAXON_ID=0 /ORGANISM="Stereomyxa ramosa, Strain Chinc5" /LENGTH=174 /DNA_ID=CAMNT_0015360175 /DNA_START=168 /DNA_END=688 /DNA_ORIENTATION=-
MEEVMALRKLVQLKNEKRNKSKKLNLVGTIKDYAALYKGYLGWANLGLMGLGYHMAGPIVFDTFMYSCLGTGLTIWSALTINCILEKDEDLVMPRTYLRPIPQERISVPSAWGFAGLTGIGGAVMLHQLVNPAAALFAFSNLVLYSFIYTPLKKYHSINTSVGALVGAVPPIIG